MTAVTIFCGIATLTALIAAFTDWRTGLIPNWLTLPPLVVFPLAYALTLGMTGLALSVGGLIACGLIPYVMFRMGGMAGGDVKLLAALGAMLGPFMGIEAEFFAFIFAALFSLGRLAWRGKLMGTLTNALYLGLNPVLPPKWKRELHPELMQELRFGPAIFAGTLAAVVSNHVSFASLFG